MTNPDTLEAGVKMEACPFCTGRPHILPRPDFTKVAYLVFCDDCKASTAVCATEAEAIAAWNRRASPPYPSGGEGPVAFIPQADLDRLARTGLSDCRLYRKATGSRFVIPLFTSPPAPSEARVEAVTDDQVLAGCRIIYPGLFSAGMTPRPGDGPATQRKMAETADQVRRILTAALSGGAP